MPTWLEIVIGSIALVFAGYAIDVHRDFRAMEKEFAEAKRMIIQLDYKMQIANEKIRRLQQEVYKSEAKTTDIKKKSKMPDFLSADDPLDALLSEVGKLSR